MSINAIISADHDYGENLLGLNLLERSILSLHRAGISKISVACPEDREVESILSRSKALAKKEINVKIIRKKPGKLAAGQYLIINSNTVFDWKGLAEIVSGDRKSKTILTDADGNPAAEWMNPVSALSYLKLVFEGKVRKKSKKAGESFPGWGAVSVENKSSYRKARRALLKSMRKPTDGFISRNFNRFVSLFLTRFFLVLRLTPNSISFGNLGLGVLAAVLIATTSPGEYWKILVSGLIFQLTSIVDGCDGEVAKLSFSDSDKGAWIDTVCDQLGYFTFFIGLPVGLFHATKNPLYIVLGGMTFVFIGLLFYMMTRYVKRRGEGGSMLLIINDIESVSRGRGWFAFLNKLVFGMSFIFRRDFFAFFAMTFCILNSVWILQWFISVFVTLQSLYIVFFSWYSEKQRLKK